MDDVSKILRIRKARQIPGLLAVCALSLGLLCSAAPVQAQYSSENNNRLSRIENELETLSRAIYKGEDPPPPSSFSNGGGAAADTEVRLQQLESQIRDLNGKVEEQSFQIRQVQEQLERSLSDMEMRLNDMSGTPGSATSSPPSDNYGGTIDSAPPQPGGYTSGANTYSRGAGAQSYQDSMAAEASGASDYQWNSSGSGAQDAPGQLGTLTTSGSGSSSSADAAAAQYENAFALLKNGQYDTAETEFNSFISGNPDHILISNAKYWLGETYYARGKFEDAARVFAEGYQQYPKGSKAADNLLKLAMSLGGMGNKDDACVALAQLGKDFATGAGPVLRRADQEKSRLGCS